MPVSSEQMLMSERWRGHLRAPPTRDWEGEAEQTPVSTRLFLLQTEVLDEEKETLPTPDPSMREIRDGGEEGGVYP